jgi:hypothetical protein
MTAAMIDAIETARVAYARVVATEAALVAALTTGSMVAVANARRDHEQARADHDKASVALLAALGR